jgi:hypothetical protein
MVSAMLYFTGDFPESYLVLGNGPLEVIDTEEMESVQ